MYVHVMYSVEQLVWQYFPRIISAVIGIEAYSVAIIIAIYVFMISYCLDNFHAYWVPTFAIYFLKVYNNMSVTNVLY